MGNILDIDIYNREKHPAYGYIHWMALPLCYMEIVYLDDTECVNFLLFD